MRVPEGVRAVLLDLDGTLLDTAPELAAAAADMLAELGLEPVDAEVVRGFIGKGAAHLVQRTLQASLGKRPDERRTGYGLESFFTHYERRNGSAAQPYPGVLKGLARLREQGKVLACVTNKPERFTAPLLAATGLDVYFRTMIGGDTLPRKKPAPDPLLEACARLDVAPAQALMIGDSANDALAARAAGSPVWLVPYGYLEGAQVQDIDCDGIVNSILHAAGLLETRT